MQLQKDASTSEFYKLRGKDEPELRARLFAENTSIRELTLEVPVHVDYKFSLPVVVAKQVDDDEQIPNFENKLGSGVSAGVEILQTDQYEVTM